MSSISVVMVCRNEIKNIKNVIDSFYKQSYIPDEVIIVDGLSNDGTYEYLKEQEKTFKNLKVLQNERIYTPHGLNIGIKNSSSDYIMIAGAHTNYNNNYIKSIKDYLDTHMDVGIVGGISKGTPSKNTLLAKSFADSYSCIFGVGAKHRVFNTEQEVDTVAYAAYRKELFERYGLFDERLLRNQDIELNYRFRKNGIKIIMLPIENKYFAPNSLHEFIKKNFDNGYWNFITLKLTPHGISFRHFIPMFFVLLLILFLSFFFINTIRNILLIPMAFYLLLDVLFSLKEKNLFLLIIFPILHISYGVGTLISLIKNFKIKPEVSKWKIFMWLNIH